MPAWITITPEDLNAYQVAKVVAAARTKALASGQDDPFEEVMPNVVKQMRDDIKAWRSNVLSATPQSVPAGLKEQAIYLILERMIPRLMLELSDDLKTLIKDAKERMKLIAKGERDVDQPDDPEASQTLQSSGPMAQTLSQRPRQNTRQSMGRL